MGWVNISLQQGARYQCLADAVNYNLPTCKAKNHGYVQHFHFLIPDTIKCMKSWWNRLNRRELSVNQNVDWKNIYALDDMKSPKGNTGADDTCHNNDTTHNEHMKD